MGVPVKKTTRDGYRGHSLIPGPARKPDMETRSLPIWPFQQVQSVSLKI